MRPEAYQNLHEHEATHWWYRGMWAISEALLDSVLNGRADAVILDAGCGTGGTTRRLAHYGRVTGIDAIKLALEYARQTPLDTIARAGVEHLPFEDGCFDLVTSFDVIYHQNVADDRAALAEMARVLKPGGYLLLRVPAMKALKGPHDTLVHGARRYTNRDVNEMLAGAGLQSVRMTYANAMLFPVVYVIRRGQALLTGNAMIPTSDISEMADVWNRMLTSVMKFEARWIGKGRNFPFGVSLVALARKPA